MPIDTPLVVASLMIADGGDFVGRPVSSLTMIQGGLAEDRHAGTTMRANGRTPWHERGAQIANVRQVSLVSVEECAEIAALLGLDALDPALLGPNLVLRGMPGFSQVPPGARLQLPSGATLFVTEQNVPCRHPAERIAAAYDDPTLAGRFARAALGRRGLLALVESGGVVGVGDSIRMVKLRIEQPLSLSAGIG